MKPSRSEFIDIRGLRYHLREWGAADADAAHTWVMLHGWMDVSASFQFVIDELPDDWKIVAPDWRGFGLSARATADCYWFPDYLADLEFILDAVLRGERAWLLGHSMGGNIALVYAGTRPDRVRAVVNLEGFGLRATAAEQAPDRFSQWIDELKAGAALRDYASRHEVAARLMKNNRRLSPDRAAFLAEHWAVPDGSGRFAVAGDPAHRIVNPALYRIDEVLACWSQVECPVLWVRAAQSDVLRHVGPDHEAALREVDARKEVLRNVTSVLIEDAGHMVHHDQPEQLAHLITAFAQQHRSQL
ncbi:MAG: alpha/beta hydrolase [Burkholderiaceae bacterium]|nr:alpha/beta hydrolase [Burkholderiaceae bacterium]